MGPMAGLGFYQVGTGGSSGPITIIAGEGLNLTLAADQVVATVADSPLVAVAGPGAITVTIPGG